MKRPLLRLLLGWPAIRLLISATWSDGAAPDLAQRGAVVIGILPAFDLRQLQLHVAQLLFQNADARIGAGGAGRRVCAAAGTLSAAVPVSKKKNQTPVA